MMLFNIKGEYLNEHPDAEKLPSGVFGPSFFAFTVILSTASIVITLALFFLIPRVGIGLLPKKTLDTVKVSGFSERVELGAIGPIKNDPTIVMRVTFPEAPHPAEPLYFRGQSLDLYDGASWSRAEREKLKIESRGQGLYTIRGYEKDMLEQRILLEPLDTDVLFAADRPNGVLGSFTHLWTDGAGAIHLYSPPYSRIEYTAFSTLRSRGANSAIKAEAGPVKANLDSRAVSEAVRTLAIETTVGAESDSAKAEKISEYLNKNYRYTLKPASRAGVAPLDDFLFGSKEGYCEHYATALAVMLRATGVPTRIVTGFVQGEWNAYGNYLVVRQEDAHTWVEAYMDGAWTSFDPTPQAGLGGAAPSSNTSLFMDSLRYKWMRYIVRYTLSDQMKAAQSVEGGLTSFIQRLREDFEFLTGNEGRAPRKSGVTAKSGMTVGIIMVIAILVIYLKTAAKRGKGADKAPGYYIKMEAILKKKGFLRKAFETPLEFAGRVKIKDVTLITEAYNAERFGHTRATPAELRRIDEGLTRLNT